MNNKTFQIVNKMGKTEWIVLRQIAGIDKLYYIGSKIKGLGTVIGIGVELKYPGN